MLKTRCLRPIAWCVAVMIAGLSHQAIAQVKADAQSSPQVFVTVADLHVTDDASMAGFRQAIESINNVIKPSFVYIAGDTPDGGTPEQYKAYKAMRDTIKVPVCDVAGDHEARGNGMDTYRKTLGEPTYAFESGPYRVLGLNSMGLDQAQLDWVKKELATAKDKKQVPLVLIHHNLAGLKDKAIVGQLDKLLTDGDVKLVLTGHTHTNTVINNGGRLDISTTSIKAPRGKDPKGYAIVTLDQGGVAWHFVPLGQQTMVAIANPVSKLMATGPEAVVKGKTALRVRAYDAKGIKTVSASVAGGQALDLKQDASGTWTAEIDSTSLKDGEQALKVTATNADGQAATEEIVMLVNQAGTFTATPATVSDGGPGGPDGKGKDKGPKGPDGKGPKGGPPNKQPVTMEQLPDAVRQAVKKQAGDSEIAKLEKEVKDDQTSYKAEWVVKEKKQELRLAADGAVLESKQEISAADLPEVVATAAKKTIPDLKDAECKKVTKAVDGKPEARFEIKADVQGEKKNLLISAGGQVEVKGPGGAKGPK
jgi:predicted phosphodiesterase